MAKSGFRLPIAFEAIVIFLLAHLFVLSLSGRLDRFVEVFSKRLRRRGGHLTASSVHFHFLLSCELGDFGQLGRAWALICHLDFRFIGLASVGTLPPARSLVVG